MLLKNGGNGPALRVRGKVIFGSNAEAVEETTLGPGEEQVVWLRGASGRWGENVNGRLSHTDLTGEEREVLFTFETSAEGRAFSSASSTGPWAARVRRSSLPSRR